MQTRTRISRRTFLEVAAATAATTTLAGCFGVGSSQTTTSGNSSTIQVWNGFLFPLVLTQSASVRVLPLAL